MNLADVDAMFARIFGIKPDDPDTSDEPEESREPDPPAPEEVAEGYRFKHEGE